MAVRKLNPVTPGQRHKVAITFDQLTTDRPEKSLLGPKSKTGGRNNTGKMTMRYIGGGHKQRYRIIDFKRDKDNVPARVATIESDPGEFDEEFHVGGLQDLVDLDLVVSQVGVHMFPAHIGAV